MATITDYKTLFLNIPLFNLNNFSFSKCTLSHLPSVPDGCQPFKRPADSFQWERWKKLHFLREIDFYKNMANVDL
jgi:hypothetical protein